MAKREQTVKEASASVLTEDGKGATQPDTIPKPENESQKMCLAKLRRR